MSQPFAGAWGVWVDLTTNFAKYLPGNVWHLYGRIKAVSAAGVFPGAATLMAWLYKRLIIRTS